MTVTCPSCGSTHRKEVDIAEDGGGFEFRCPSCGKRYVVNFDFQEDEEDE